MLIACIGGGAVLVGFLALPLINAGIFGSYGALQMISVLGDSTNDNYIPALSALCFLGAAGALITLEGGYAWLSSGRSGMPPHRASKWGIAAPAVGGIIAMILLVVGAQSAGLQDPLSAAGGGFWLMAVGFVISLVGAFV